MKKLILMLSVLFLMGCQDMTVGWNSGDVINNDVFLASYKQCVESVGGYPRVTGLSFRYCLMDAYNLAMEK